MPIYVYTCKQCGCADELYRNISERYDQVLCVNCHEKMDLQILAPAIKMGEPGMGERLNKNYAERQERKKRGEFVGDKNAL